MNANTFKRIIDAIAQFTPNVNMWDVRECQKITVSNMERPELLKTMFDCYVLPLDSNDNAIIIKLSADKNDIIIFKTVVEKGICYGYDYCTYVETKGRTQIEITAELMSVLPPFITSIFESEVNINDAF